MTKVLLENYSNGLFNEIGFSKFTAKISSASTEAPTESALTKGKSEQNKQYTHLRFNELV